MCKKERSVLPAAQYTGKGQHCRADVVGEVQIRKRNAGVAYRAALQSIHRSLLEINAIVGEDRQRWSWRLQRDDSGSNSDRGSKFDSRSEPDISSDSESSSHVADDVSSSVGDADNSFDAAKMAETFAAVLNKQDPLDDYHHWYLSHLAHSQVSLPAFDLSEYFQEVISVSSKSSDLNEHSHTRHS